MEGDFEICYIEKVNEDKNYVQRLGMLELGQDIYDKILKEYIMICKLLNSVLKNM